VDKITSDVVSLTGDLVRIKSDSQLSNVEITDFVQRRLDGFGFASERLEYTDYNGVPKACLVAKIGAGEDGFGIFGHFDTVPGMEDQWQPYEPHIDGDRLIGRGACDMKGPLAAAIVAVSQLPLNRLRSPLYFVVSADEEMHYTGAYQIRDHSKILADAWPHSGLVIEPTRLRPVYAHKGGVRIRVMAEGVAAHTSTGEGVSANFLIAPFLAEMAELAKRFKTDERFLNHEFAPPHNAFNMVLDDGDCAPNVTAARTVCTMSMRPMPDDHHEEAIQLIRDAAAKYDLPCAVISFPVVYTDPESDVVRVAVEATGAERPETVPFGTEAAIYKDYCDLVILGPGDIAQAHTIGEWIDTNQLRAAVDLYAQMMRRFCL